MDWAYHCSDRLIALVWTAKSLRDKGKLYSYIVKKFPGVASFIDELFAANVSSKKFSGAVLFLTGVEFTGMFHLYIAMLALGVTPSFPIAAIAYIASVLLMITSPFLRGLGALEISIVYILEFYGYSTVQALSVTILYRVFDSGYRCCWAYLPLHGGEKIYLSELFPHFSFLHKAS